ncbi:hypothetical protein PspCFBP13528_13775 [Pseudomonas sp. CFBP13528]|nr:hypothetical protein PspCFBP13528_13775 [Pseudomonas sp. CFBP13528]
MWEGACPRWRSISRQMCKLTHRYRGQAPSHIGCPVFRRAAFAIMAPFSYFPIGPTCRKTLTPPSKTPPPPAPRPCCVAWAWCRRWRPVRGI